LKSLLVEIHLENIFTRIANLYFRLIKRGLLRTTLWTNNLHYFASRVYLPFSS